MKAEEFVKQQIEAGYEIHYHDGVWWQKIVVQFYKPVIPLQVITPNVAKPKFSKSSFGYSHLVNNEQYANKFRSVMMLNNEKLKDYSYKNISSAKRARVRKGLKLNEIKKTEDINPVIDDMKNICISAAQRTQHGKPPEYYVKHYKEWRAFMLKEFSLKNREWWGVYNQGILIAYYYAYQIDDTMFISAAKSHSDFLDRCPNDALLFTFLEYCRDLKDCNKVIFGDWSNDAPSLNEFKEKYGFEKVDLPVYAWSNPVVKLVKGIIKRG